MAKKELMVITSISRNESLTLKQLSEHFHLSKEMIIALIENDIVHPLDRDNSFDLMEIKRIRRALRLERDLELNMQGVALVLELLDELELLRSRIALLEKHLMK